MSSAKWTPPGATEVQTDSFLEFDLMAILRIMRKRAGVIIGITVVLTALIVLAITQMRPLYTAQTLVLVDSQKSNVVDMEAVVSGIPANDAALDSEVEVIKSRNLIERVVDNENLIDDPEFNSALREPSALRWLNPRYLLGRLFSLLSPSDQTDAVEQSASQEEMTQRSVVDSVLSDLEVARRGLTYTIEINFTSENRYKAAKIANAIANAYIVDQLDAKFNATKQANEWLAGRLDDLRRQVTDSERAVELYRSRHGLEESKGMTVTEQQLSELNAQLILARTNLVEARAKYNRARQLRREGKGVETVGDVVQSGTISALRQKQAELTREEANLSAKYGPRHPAIVNIEAQQKDIQSQIAAEAGRIIESLRNDVSVASTRVRALESNLKEIKGETGTNNEALIQLRELERKATANRQVYEAFLKRFKETSEQEDIQTPDTRVISKAVVPGGPSFPKTSLFVMLGFALSLMTGVGAAFLLEHLDNGIQTSGDLERLLALPNLASIPLTPKERGPDGKVLSPQDYLVMKPLSSYSEAFRSLRSALQFSNVDNPPKVVLFTSALPNEGKTTSAVSFARAAASAGLKVVLLDCDLRHPSVAEALKISRPEQGLVELLASRLDFKEVVIEDEKTGMEVIPVAKGTANPPDIFGSSQMKLLFERLREAYNLVVVDSPPVMPVSDARVLSQIVDETVFVARWNETPRDALQNAVKQLRDFGAPLAGTVLSMVDTAKQAKYGYGDGGYYYSRYSKYYVN